MIEEFDEDFIVIVLFIESNGVSKRCFVDILLNFFVCF